MPTTITADHYDAAVLYAEATDQPTPVTADDVAALLDERDAD